MVIKGLLFDGKTVEEIKEHLDRSPKSKVVEKFLETLNLVTEEKTGDPMDESSEDTITTNEEVDMTNWESVISHLMSKDLTREQAEDYLRTSLKSDSFLEHEDPEDNAKEVLKTQKSGDMMRKTAMAGRTGIVLMTGAASERADEAKKYYKDPVNKNVYKPKG